MHFPLIFGFTKACPLQNYLTNQESGIGIAQIKAKVLNVDFKILL